MRNIPASIHQAGWQSFLNKNALKTDMENLSALTEEIWKFLEMPLTNESAHQNASVWKPAKRKWE